MPPVTAGIGVWLDGVRQAGMYDTAERMNGRTRLHRCQEGIPVNMVRGYFEDRLERTRHKMCRHQLGTSGLGRTTKKLDFSYTIHKCATMYNAKPYSNVTKSTGATVKRAYVSQVRANRTPHNN